MKYINILEFLMQDVFGAITSCNGICSQICWYDTILPATHVTSYLSPNAQMHGSQATALIVTDDSIYWKGICSAV